jgi:prepilin-type processing-associated H-X9-DG protein
MYAGEARGQYAPMSMWYGEVTDCDTVDALGQPTFEKIIGQFENTIDTIFNIPVMFPEYLDDFEILVCPSDGGTSIDDWQNPITQQKEACSCVQGDGTGVDGSRGFKLGDASYVYVGWLLDKADDTPAHAVLYSTTVSGQVIGSGRDLMENAQAMLSAQIAGWVPLSHFPVPVGGPQPTEWAELSRNTIDGGDFGLVVAMAGSPGCPSGCGNGSPDSTSIFNLKEGLGRFLITDINNPGASSKADSDIWIMNDWISARVQNYNHVPGGANVLYLDGHVEYTVFPSKTPPNNHGAMWPMTWRGLN